MKIFWKNNLFFLIIVSLLIQPFLLFIPQKTKATPETNTINSENNPEDDFVDPDRFVANQEEADYSKNLESNTESNFLRFMGNATAISNDNDIEEQLLLSSDPRLVLNADDYLAVKGLYCLANSDIIFDFENDFVNTLRYIPASVPSNLSPRPQNEDELRKLKFREPAKFAGLVDLARKNWGSLNKDNISRNLSILKCTDENVEDYASTDPEYISALVDDIVNSLVMDVRVLKTLVYLVTPKNQGGAGHWRIRVQRIRSGYESKSLKRQLTRESDVNIEKIAEQNKSSAKTTQTTYSEATDFSGQTASEIGLSREVQAVDEKSGSLATATAEDKNGDQYEVYLANQSENSDKTGGKNISAHVDGRAIDISEIDDIRCTKVKKRRVGRDSKTKFSQNSIKLAWQTQAGFDESGGLGELKSDISNVYKSLAKDSLTDLLAEFDTDISDYEGDLSTAGFSDIAKLIGQTMLSEVINSPNANFSGYNIEDTLNKLGSIYFADYLGLPREIFLNKQKVNSLEDIERIVGQSAIEKRLSLPLETFSGTNLEETLTGIGQRKIEYEMGLNEGDLKAMIYNPSLSSDFTLNVSNAGKSTFSIPVYSTLVGQAVIEKALSLKKGSFEGKDFPTLKKNMGKYKGEMLFANPPAIDSALHLDDGMTEKLKKGEIGITEYKRMVGQTRLDDTAYGFSYLSSHDSAYGLPENTWTSAINGDKENLKQIGVYTMARAFTAGDEQRQAITAWISNNLGKVAPEDCYIPGEITQTISVKKSQTETETKNVIISEENAISVGMARGDLFRLFGCGKASGQSVFERIGSKILFYAFTNKALDPESQLKIDLMDATPQLVSADPETSFYLTRMQRAAELSKRIKDNWKDVNDFPDREYVTKTVDNIINLIGDSGKISTSRSKEVVKKVSVEVDSLKTRMKEHQSVNKAYITKTNATLFDLSELVNVCTEIMEGKEMPTSEKIKASQIPSSIFSDATDTSGSSVSKSSRGNEKITYVNTQGKINKLSIILLLSKKQSPKDFFISLGAGRAEESLGLPANSFLYFVQNYEKKGINSRDAFYSAIGQARIEEEFSMPKYYFQGPIMKSDLEMPDFDNDLTELLHYVDTGDTSFKLFSSDSDIYKLNIMDAAPSSAKTTKIDLSKFSVPKDAGQTFNAPAKLAPEKSTRDYFAENVNKVYALADIKKNNPEQFKKLVLQAQALYRDQMQSVINMVGGNEEFESSIDDIAINVRYYKLSDGIRSPEEDIAFRMGMTGNYSGLTNGSLGSWLQAGGRAEKIDQAFGIKEGSTRSLFTGQTVSGGSGKNILSAKEKQILSAKMNVSVGTIEKYLSALNGETDPKTLENGSSSVYYNPYNPYAEKSGYNTAGSCPSNFSDKNGFSLAENLLVDKSYTYTDQDGTKSFQNKEEADRYAREHADKRMDALTELAIGIVKLLGREGSGAIEAQKSDLKTILNNKSRNVSFSSDPGTLAEFEKKNGFSIDILEKMLNPAEAISIGKPLPAYKIAVGKAEAKKMITWKLFSGLGVKIDPSVFTGDDLFTVLQGDLDPLYKLGGAMIDSKLNLQSGTTFSLISAKSVNIRQCTLAQAGGQILGSLVGLNYVNFTDGNIINNMGQSKVEETLGFPRGTFRGDNLDTLIRNNPLDFALGFNIPIDSVDMGPVIYKIYSGDYGERVNTLSGEFKLQKIKDYLTANAYIPSDLAGALNTLNNKIYDQTKKVLQNNEYWADDYKVSANGPFWDELRKMLSNASYLDTTFGLTAGTTRKFLSQKETKVCKQAIVDKGFAGKFEETQCSYKAMTPDDYRISVGDNTLKQVAFISTLDILGVEGYKADAIVTLAANFRGWVAKKQYGDIYSNLTKFFDANFDARADFTPGTFESILNNPARAPAILLTEAIRKFDQRVNLESGSATSFTYVYATYQLRSDTCSKNYMDPAAEKDRQQEKDTIVNNALGVKGDLAVAYNSPLDTPSLNVPDLNQPANSPGLERLGQINSETEKANLDYQNCQKDARKYFGREAWQTAQFMVSTQLSEKIFTATDGTLHMPQEDLQQLVFHGDIRYLGIALLSYGANRVMNKDEQMETIPWYMRLSYDDFKLSFLGDAGSEEYAADAAAYGVLHNTTIDYDNSLVNARYGDLSPDGTDKGGILGYMFSEDMYSGNATSDRSHDTLISANRYTFEQINGFDAGKRGQVQSELQKLDSDLGDCYMTLNSYETTEQLQHCLNTYQTYYDVTDAREKAVENSRTMFRQDVQFRTMDIALWKTDHNIYPGFAYAMMKGNEKTKILAISNYLKNGVMNGQFFGHDVDWLKELNDKVGAYDIGIFVKALIDNNKSDAVAFDKFVEQGSRGFDLLKNFISGNSEKWFGFEIDPQLAGGLLVGAFTGNWGFQNGLNAPDHPYKTAGGRDIMTVGGWGVKFGLSRVFNWADAQLGLPPGTSFQVYGYGKQIYEAIQVSKQIGVIQTAFDQVAEAQKFMNGEIGLPFEYSGKTYDQLSSLEKTHVAATANGNNLNQAIANNPQGAEAIKTGSKLDKPLTKNNYDNGIAGKQRANYKEIGVGIGIALISSWITKYVENAYGERIAQFEENLGLVPGSTMILVGAGITWGLSAIAYNSHWIVSTAWQGGPYAALAMFVLVNLFGVYKVELKCSADGYYPMIENPPSDSIADVAGIGVWNGMDQGTAQAKMIQSAQYKARRLIGDVIEMQNNPTYKDVIPSQVMTGRQEDVDYWNSAISVDICSKMGMTAVKGVCGGNTRAGLWQNPQTVAWTHIGY